MGKGFWGTINPFDDDPGHGFNGGTAEKIANTAADFTPVGWGSRLITGDGAFTAGRKAFGGDGIDLVGNTKYRAQAPQIGEYDPAAQAAYEQRKAELEQRLAALGAQRGGGVLAVANRAAEIGRISQELGAPSPMSQADPNAVRLEQGRGYSTGLLNQLQDAAAGNGPSQALDALKAGTARTMASQYSLAASAPAAGAQGAALLNQAMWNAAGAQQQGARESAQLRAQEMTDARQQLGAVSGQQQQQDIARAQTNINSSNAVQGINAGIETQNSANKAQFTGNVMKTAGAIFAASDIRAKEEIMPVEPPKTGTRVQPTPIKLWDDSQHNGLSEDEYNKATRVNLDMRNPWSITDEEKQRRLDNFKLLGPSVSQGDDTSGDADWYGAKPQEATQPAGQDDEEDRPMFRGATPNSRTAFSGTLSDARSKERIRELEGALASANGQASQVRGARVEYPDIGLSRMATPEGSREALAPIGEYQYRYKPDFAKVTGDDTQPRIGVMAQELERSPNPALRSAVVETPTGKAIDGSRALSASLALGAGLDKRLRDIEERMGRPTVYPGLGLSKRFQ